MKVLLYRALGWYPYFRKVNFTEYPQLKSLDEMPVNIEILLECQKGYWLINGTFKKNLTEIAEKLTNAYKKIIQGSKAQEIAQNIRAVNDELFTYTANDILHEDSLDKLAEEIISYSDY